MDALTGTGGSLVDSWSLCPSLVSAILGQASPFCGTEIFRPQVGEPGLLGRQMMAVIIFEGISFTWEGT